MYHLKIEIAGLPRTINQTGRAHWAVKAREAKMWRCAVAYLSKDKKPEAPLEKAKIIFTRHSATCPDFDNLAISFKSCLDGLRDGGVILDDKMVNVGAPDYVWEKSKRGEGRITIQVDEIS